MATIRVPGPPANRLRVRRRIELDGVFYRFLFFWSRRTRAWHMDVDNDAGVAQVHGVRLSLGNDHLDSFKHLDVPQGSFNVVDLENQDQEAGIDDFGIRVEMQYVEVTAA